MASDEVVNLKSEILFGSTHCSCSSCDTVRCFEMRNVKANECRCPTCKGPTTCLYNAKKEQIDTPKQKEKELEKLPSNDSKNAFDGVEVIHKTDKKSKRGKLHDKNIVNIKIVKKNVIIQTVPQKLKESDVQSDHCNTSNSSLGYLINKIITNYKNVSIQQVVDKITEINKYNSKVLECLLSNTECSCKPCDCDECKSMLMRIFGSGSKDANSKNGVEVKKLAFDLSFTNIYNTQVSSVKSGRRDGDFSTKANEICECTPYDCNQCRIYNITCVKDGEPIQNPVSRSSEIDKSDNFACKSVQCITCRSIVKDRVPPKENSQRNNACHCNICKPNSAPVSYELPRQIVQSSRCRCELCVDQKCREIMESCKCNGRNNNSENNFDDPKQNIDIDSAPATRKIPEDDTCTLSVLIEDSIDRKDKVLQNGKSTDVSAAKQFRRLRNSSTVRISDRSISRCRCDPCECIICEKFKLTEQEIPKPREFGGSLHCKHLLKTDGNIKMEQTDVNSTANEIDSNKDRSIYLALLHDVYSDACAYQNYIDANKYLFKNKAVITQSKKERKSFLDSETRSDLKTNSNIFVQYMPFQLLRKHQNFQPAIDNTIVTTFINDITKIGKITNTYLYKSYSIFEDVEDETSNNTNTDLSYISDKYLKGGINEEYVFNDVDESSPQPEKGIIHKCYGKTNLVPEEYRNRNEEINSASISRVKTTLSNILHKNIDEEFVQPCVSSFEGSDILFKAKLLTCELLKMLFSSQKANKELQSLKGNSNIISKSYSKEIDLTNTSNLDFKYSWSNLSIRRNKRWIKDFSTNTKIKLNTDKRCAYKNIFKRKPSIIDNKCKGASTCDEEKNTFKTSTISKKLTTIYKKVESFNSSEKNSIDVKDFFKSKKRKLNRSESLNSTKIKHPDLGRIIKNNLLVKSNTY